MEKEKLTIVYIYLKSHVYLRWFLTYFLSKDEIHQKTDNLIIFSV